MCVFCLTYSILAQKNNWSVSAILAVAAYLLTTVSLNYFTWKLLPAFTILFIVIFMVLQIVPRKSVAQNNSASPRWDLPARMGIATFFVITLTTFANLLGPQLSGLISTFPIFGVIFAAFTHHQQGPQAASNLLRGIVFGSMSFGLFFLSVGTFLIPLGIVAAYTIALAAALTMSGISYFITHNKKNKGDEQIPARVTKWR